MWALNSSDKTASSHQVPASNCCSGRSHFPSLFLSLTRCLTQNLYIWRPPRHPLHCSDLDAKWDCSSWEFFAPQLIKLIAQFPSHRLRNVCKSSFDCKLAHGGSPHSQTAPTLSDCMRLIHVGAASFCFAHKSHGLMTRLHFSSNNSSWQMLFCFVFCFLSCLTSTRPDFDCQ